MIKAIIGSGGSGKSLYFIRYLFEETTIYEYEEIDGKEVETKVKKAVHELYGRLILNIKGFNEDKFRELSGNNDIEIIHESKHWDKKDIQRIFKQQELEDEKDENERVPTLLIYDECQFGLSTFSQAQNAIAQNEYIANFMSLHRHYGPCDIFLATQSADKIHGKFVGDLDELFISLESNQKLDPENDIVFDQYDKDGKSIITGGRSKIKFKKLDNLKSHDGNDFLPFELYTSGDAGRRPIKRKSFWGKYIYIFGFAMVAIITVTFFVFYNLFDKMKEPIKAKEFTPTKEQVQKYKDHPLIDKDKDNNVTVPARLMKRMTKEYKDSQFDRYLDTPYHNIDGQMLYKIFINKNRCYIGNQILTKKTLYKLINDNVIYKISEQKITKNSKYINVLIHQSLFNSYRILNDFDNTPESNAKGGKSKDMF